jgi:hypothetical protein
MIRPGTEALVKAVIQARDPEDKFRRVEAVRFPATIWGPFFETNGNAKAFARDGLRLTVWTKKRKVLFENFPKRGMNSVYLEDRAYTATQSGIGIDEIERPLERLGRVSRKGGLAFALESMGEYEGGSPFDLMALPFQAMNDMAGNPLGKITRLTALDQMSFISYAAINYFLFPNVLTDPAKVESVEKTGPFELTVTYRRDVFPTHSKVQTYRFDPRTLLLDEHFYRVAYIDSQIQARHRTSRHQFADGMAYADKRRVRVSLMGEATRNSKKAISADIGRIEVLYQDPDGE